MVLPTGSPIIERSEDQAPRLQDPTLDAHAPGLPLTSARFSRDLCIKTRSITC
jgi:hypothetical protein